MRGVWQDTVDVFKFAKTCEAGGGFMYVVNLVCGHGVKRRLLREPVPARLFCHHCTEAKRERLISGAA